MASHIPRTHFGKALAAANKISGGGRRWLFVPYDQLNDQIGPLSREAAGDVGIICIETRWKPQRRRYHKQKLALIVANQRHFALEQARRGVAVRYVSCEHSYGAALAELRGTLGSIECMQPAEEELRADIQDHVSFLPHEGWLTHPQDFEALNGPPWRMDAFYRRVRKKTGVLMDGEKPRGGRWSFDADNRRPYRGDPPLPSLPTFKPDDISREAGDMIADRYAEHPGTLNLHTLPTTLQDAKALWQWAQSECLPHFGPYEDAMTSHSTNLFHTRLSPLLNISRLLPRDIIADALALPIELASLEGFVRQILGWREFMHHVHKSTRGLRTVKEQNVLGAQQPVYPAFWGKPSGLACLDTVVRSVWAEGYSHHITRLMILCNFGSLLDINPRELTDWFWVAYIDAYDWVMETNGMGMGLYALGGVMTTKPYVSGAAYINRMSDYCKTCAFNPKKDCPVTPLYWAFLARHEELLGPNPRMMPIMNSLKRRQAAQRQSDSQVATWVQKTLSAGAKLLPENRP